MPARGSQADATRRPPRKSQPASAFGHGAAPADYFQQLLGLICDAVAPRAAVAWGIDEHGVLSKIAELVPAPGRTEPTKTAARARAKRLLDALLIEGPQVCPLGKSTVDGVGDVELLVPFHDQTRPCGVIEVVVSTRADESSGIERATAIVQEIAGYASHYLRSERAPRNPSSAARFPELLSEFSLQLNRDLCVNQVALVAANEGRTLLGCDRIALVAPRRERLQVLAVSGQERIVTRSSLVRAMRELATALGQAHNTLQFDGDETIVPPPIRQAVLDYVNQSGSRRLEAVPLLTRSPAEAQHEAEPLCRTEGWLLCEHFQPPAAAIEPVHARAFCDHVALALQNARQLEQASTPFRRALRLFFAPSDFRSARQAGIAAAIVIAAVIGIGMLPVRYRVEASGQLLPVRRSELFAPVEGRVKEVLVDGNQQVAKGQVLLRLDNERLANEVLTTRHLLQEKQQLLATLEAQSAETKGRGDNHESIRLSGAISQAKIEIVSTQGRLRSLEEEAAELEVRSPIAGTVATFEPKQLLLHRPVQRGESLLEVMDTTGPWELRLDLPARRVGHVLRAQAAAAGAAVPVQFTLATQPDKTFAGALRTVSSRIVTGADAESVAPLEANVVVQDIPHPIAGADVIARIDCGNKSFARVLFGDVVDFFRSRLW